MNIVIPMAGWGSRLRPHTLTVPKPLVPIAGKAIVHRLVEGLMEAAPEKVDNINFIIREEFGEKIEEKLLKIAADLGTNGIISYQDEPLGTAHAILCAKESLEGKVIVAFADTLFKADFKVDSEQDGVIWVQRVEDPSAFGVIKMDDDGTITDFIEKPAEFVSDLAIIGIYYFKDGANLRKELQYLLDNNIKDKGEFQLTNALDNMNAKGVKFKPAEVVEWLDCGNKNATVYTNQRILEFIKDQGLVDSSSKVEQSTIIEPCYIGPNVEIKNSIVGPHVSIEGNTSVENSVIRNSIIQSESTILNKVLENSMIGNHVHLNGRFEDLSIGDYTSQSS